MYRYFLALAVVSALAACSTDGQPLLADDAKGVGTGDQPLQAEGTNQDEAVAEEDAVPVNSVTAENINTAESPDDLLLNTVVYDPASRELQLDGLPYDGDENLYRPEPVTTANLGNNFVAYRNISDPQPSVFSNAYYAVFRRTDYSQVVAAGTDRYISFGYGGAKAERLNDGTALPQTPESYVFTGEYAAVRVVSAGNNGNSPGQGLQYVAGTVQMDVDIEDFNRFGEPASGGAVSGIIVDREFFDSNGVAINMDPMGAGGEVDRIVLNDSQINFDSWTIQDSTARVVPINYTEINPADGNWNGLFTGPNGEEIAGIVVVQGPGPIGIDPVTGNYLYTNVAAGQEIREVGGFVARR